MFNLRRFLALFRPELYTPYERALRDLARRDYESALSRLDALLSQSDLPPAQRAAAHNKRGVAFISLGERVPARTEFESALEAVPNFAPSLVNIGNLHLEAGEVDEAIRYYERAVRSDEEYALAHHNLGVAFKRAGRIDEAVRALRRANRLEGRVVRKPRR